MKKLISHILVVLFLVFPIAAQVNENQPVLFDEFGRLSNDDLNAHLDSLAAEILKTPKSKALVRIYGGEGGAAYVRGSWIKSLWIINRKNPPEKLSIQFCNINKEPLRTRSFMIRENDKVEVCDENLTLPTATALFETIYFAQPDFELVPMENTFIYVDAAPQGEYSQFAQNALKKLLNDSPESKIYLIAYLSADFEMVKNDRIIIRKTPVLDKKSYANKMIRAARKEMLKNGFSPSQIVTIDGGYVNGNGRRLEFWFVPKGGAIPKPKPDYIPKKKRNK